MSCVIYSALISQRHSLVGTTPICKSNLICVQAYWQHEDMLFLTLPNLANISVPSSREKPC